MTDLNHEPSIEEAANADETRTPAGVMLVTMVLLISGLLLTSAMLLHYGLKKTGGPEASGQGLAQLLSQLKTREAKDPAAAEAAEKSTGFSLKNLFSRSGDKQTRWPRLKLSGFGLPSEGERGFAIINGKHVIEGSTISGARLTEIQEHGVVLEYKGETRTLIVEINEN